MLTTWRQRERRDGIVLRAVSFPVPPPSMPSLVDVFAEEMERVIARGLPA
jgi:hypothetical protein